MLDLEVLASFHGLDKPEFHGPKQDHVSDFWLGQQIVDLIKDTKVLGGFSI